MTNANANANATITEVYRALSFAISCASNLTELKARLDEAGFAWCRGDKFGAAILIYAPPGWYLGRAENRARYISRGVKFDPNPDAHIRFGDYRRGRWAVYVNNEYAGRVRATAAEDYAVLLALWEASKD